MTVYLEAVEVNVGKHRILLANAANNDPLKGLSALAGLPPHWSGKLGLPNSPIIFDRQAEDEGFENLQIVENARILWSTQRSAQLADPSAVESSLSHPGKVDWSARVFGDQLTGDLRVVNYLGSAWMGIRGEPKKLRFEVISRKIDYRVEYKQLLGDIASECEQLLLEWNSPTTHTFSPDVENPQETLLEQFLFLRHALGPDRIGTHLEEVLRNPHSSLRTETEWEESGGADASWFVGDPVSRGREFFRMGNSDGQRWVPRAIEVQRKFASFDTAPNRFLKYALRQFGELCLSVVKSFRGVGGPAYSEATQMAAALDEVLAEPFWRDIGELAHLPFANPTLQQRSGYREIYQSWLMVDLAAKLDWKGRRDGYEGTNRDVATLYEYWLFFIIRRTLIGRLGAKELKDAPVGNLAPFLKRTGQRLSITLKQGVTSLAAFQMVDQFAGTRVHLYYNRSFSRAPSADSAASYSRIFRPDFTLVFLPESYVTSGASALKAEEQAERNGRLAFVHFDAKYRVERMEELFGLPEADGQEDEIELGAGPRARYKRTDLLKMHTYNDAIRRTAASFVLYPGRGQAPDSFNKFHEILPGVGAVSVRPTPSGPDGADALATLLASAIAIHANHYGEFHRLRYSEHIATRLSFPSTTSTFPPPLRGELAGDTNVALVRVGDPSTSIIGDEVFVEEYSNSGILSTASLQRSRSSYVAVVDGSLRLTRLASVKSSSLTAQPRDDGGVDFRNVIRLSEDVALTEIYLLEAPYPSIGSVTWQWLAENVRGSSTVEHQSNP